MGTATISNVCKIDGAVPLAGQNVVSLFREGGKRMKPLANRPALLRHDGPLNHCQSLPNVRISE